MSVHCVHPAYVVVVVHQQRWPTHVRTDSFFFHPFVLHDVRTELLMVELITGCRAEVRVLGWIELELVSVEWLPQCDLFEIDFLLEQVGELGWIVEAGCRRSETRVEVHDLRLLLVLGFLRRGVLGDVVGARVAPSGGLLEELARLVDLWLGSPVDAGLTLVNSLDASVFSRDVALWFHCFIPCAERAILDRCMLAHSWLCFLHFQVFCRLALTNSLRLRHFQLHPYSSVAGPERATLVQIHTHLRP